MEIPSLPAMLILPARPGIEVQNFYKSFFHLLLFLYLCRPFTISGDGALLGNTINNICKRKN